MPAAVRAIVTADHFLLDIRGGCEIELFLIDVEPAEPIGEGFYELTPQARAQRNAAAQIVGPGRVVCFIPQPQYDRGWIRNIRPRTKHAGYLFTTEGKQINQQIARIQKRHARKEKAGSSHSYDYRGGDAQPPRRLTA